MEGSHKPSFAILGVGAVGGLYGGLLSKSGYPVHFLARSDAEHLRESGLRVDTPFGDFQLQQLQIYDTPSEMPVVDYVLVSWKTTSNDHLRAVLPHICGPETVVVMLQNGLDVESIAAEVVGSDRVLGACVFLCAYKAGPGYVQHLDYGEIAFGEYDPALAGQVTPRMQRLAAELSSAGIEAQPVPNLLEIRWKKLAWNVPFNGLSVVLESDTSSLMGNPHSCQLAEHLMREVVESAAASGVSLPPDHIAQTLEYTRQMVPYASSMLLDYRAMRPLELEAIFGTPIRTAKSFGYQPVRIEMLYQQLSYLDAVSRAADRPN